jgi:catechol 2,3-dioxygenase-like lactoylglutathione lyase family enzyme
MAMITGTHAIIYAEDADKARAFFRDVLDLPYVDAHGGWLIFKLPPAELGIHPSGEPDDPNNQAPNGHHEIYLMCDDVEATVAELTAKGVEFTSPVEDQGFGRLTRFRVPGAGEIGLYQPRHAVAYDLDG